MRIRTGLVLVGAILATAPPALAGSAKPAPAFPQSVTNLLDCRKIADPAERLACFDRNSAIVAEATAKKDILITDKAEIQRTRKGLFGFAIPDSTILGADDDSPDVKRMETTVVSARRSRNGGWIVVLAEGGTWLQTDLRELALSPKPGQKVVVTKAALGSYLVSIDGQQGLKMQRIQ